jgi:prevent-host-death family protein
MSERVSLHDARTHLSDLVDRAAAGEEIVITKAGTPKARLMPLRAPAVPRWPGAWRGRVRISPDFDAPLPETVLASFEGEDGLGG